MQMEVTISIIAFIKTLLLRINGCILFSFDFQYFKERHLLLSQERPEGLLQGTYKFREMVWEKC